MSMRNVQEKKCQMTNVMFLTFVEYLTFALTLGSRFIQNAKDLRSQGKTYKHSFHMFLFVFFILFCLFSLHFIITVLCSVMFAPRVPSS